MSALPAAPLSLLATLDYQLGVVRSLPKTLDSLKYRHGLLGQQVLSHERSLGTIEVARGFYQKAIDLVYQKSVGELERLLNTALEFVFHDKVYKIRLDLSERYGKSLEIKVEDHSKSPPMVLSMENGVGLGVRTLVSFVLQVYYLLNRNACPLLLLDECWTAVSVEYVDRFMSFVNGLAKERGLMVVLISHDPRFQDYAKRAYRVTDGNVSEVIKNVTK